MSDKNTAVIALSAKELSRLSDAEIVIERGKATFVEVGLALTEIRDGKLYRDDYGTFEVYCQKRWDFARRTAYQLIDAAKVVENVRNCAQPPPATESQARPLTKLKAVDQPKAWQAAVENAKSNGRPVRAKDVEIEVGRISRSGRADWELNKTPAPKEHDPSDDESDILFHLKRYWRKAIKKDRSSFLKWVKKAQ